MRSLDHQKETRHCVPSQIRTRMDHHGACGCTESASNKLALDTVHYDQLVHLGCMKICAFLKAPQTSPGATSKNFFRRNCTCDGAQPLHLDWARSVGSEVTRITAKGQRVAVCQVVLLFRLSFLLHQSLSSSNGSQLWSRI